MDVVISLALFTALTAALIITVRRSKSGFAGYGTVQSGSMTASGLYIGDVVRVKPQNGYSKGDVIVFYRATENYGEPFDESKTGNYEIWIHEVIDVREDSLGRTTYLTKGSSNATDDGAYVPQDFVLGKAKKLSRTVSSAMNFICSVRGIIILVEVPCGIVLVYLVWDLIMTLTKGKKGKKDRAAKTDPIGLTDAADTGGLPNATDMADAGGLSDKIDTKENCAE